MLEAIRRLFRKSSREDKAIEIVRLAFTTRVLHLLIRSKQDGGLGFRTVGQILKYKQKDLLKVKGFGSIAYNEVQQRLYEHGFIPKPQYLDVRTRFLQTEMKKEQIHADCFAMSDNRQPTTGAERTIIATAQYTEEHNATENREVKEKEIG